MNKTIDYICVEFRDDFTVVYGEDGEKICGYTVREGCLFVDYCIGENEEKQAVTPLDIIMSITIRYKKETK